VVEKVVLEMIQEVLENDMEQMDIWEYFLSITLTKIISVNFAQLIWMLIQLIQEQEPEIAQAEI